jgi:hypothetical protein
MFLRSISILMLQAFSGLQWPSVAFKLLTSPASTSSKVGIRPLRPSEHFHLENSTKNWKIPLMIWSVNHWQTLSLLGFLSHSEMWVVASAFCTFKVLKRVSVTGTNKIYILIILTCNSHTPATSHYKNRDKPFFLANLEIHTLKQICFARISLRSIPE